MHSAASNSALLRIRHLDKSYAQGEKALNQVCLDVPAGQVVALIGPSGAGKSTLIRCVNRLVEPSAGDIQLKGQSLVALPSKQLRLARRRLGMIFQEYALVERLSVMENVLSGRLGYVGFWQAWRRRFPQADIQRAFELLERVGLAGFEYKRADALSGGQRQRVGIARALIQQPELLLVDEPTASLDPKTARQIMRLLCEVCREQGLSAIINIHDVALAVRYVDRVVGLRKGAVVYDGAPQALTDQVLRDIYGPEDWQGEAQTTLQEPGLMDMPWVAA